MSELIGLSAPVAPKAAADTIIDGTEQGFGQEVIEASMERPVIVDFWAPWCGPCKTLGPLIEKVVTAAGGAVKLVKIDTEQNQQIAAQMRIQSIPTVYAFYQGQPIDGFMGALPESQIQAFVDKVIDAAGGAAPADAGAPDVETILAHGEQLLESGDTQTAQAAFRAALEADSTNVQAYSGFARALLAEGRLDEVQAMMAQIPEDLLAKPEIVSLAGLMTLAERAASMPDTPSLEAAVATKPDDFDAVYALAQAQLGRGMPELGAENLLSIMAKDREWNDDGARKGLLEMFEALGHSSPLTIKYRKRLSALLFA